MSCVSEKSKGVVLEHLTVKNLEFRAIKATPAEYQAFDVVSASIEKYITTFVPQS